MYTYMNGYIHTTLFPGIVAGDKKKLRYSDKKKVQLLFKYIEKGTRKNNLYICFLQIITIMHYFEFNIITRRKKILGLF